MSVTLFFGIRLSGRPFERIRYKLDKNDFESYTAENLKIILVSEFLTNLPDHFNLGRLHVNRIHFSSKQRVC